MLAIVNLLSSIITCSLVAESGALSQPNPVHPGRRRWHGLSQASATTSSSQAVAESERFCLPRRQRRHQTRLPANWQAITRSTRRSYGRRSPRYNMKNQGLMCRRGGPQWSEAERGHEEANMMPVSTYAHIMSTLVTRGLMTLIEYFSILINIYAVS